MDYLNAENITQIYDGVTIIKDVSLRLSQGETVCLVGGSGVGKTTLFQVLSGLTTPAYGEIRLHGDIVNGKTGQVGYMLQKDLLLAHMTIIDNVSLPLRLKGNGKKEARTIAAPYFKVFGLEGVENKYPSQLSGGMKQRAALMRTYLFGKDVILLDEPFSALDEITKQELHSWYKAIVKELKISTLFISHNIDEAISLSDRIYVMSGNPGEIVGEINIAEKNKDSEFLLSQSFLDYKRQILKLLKNN